MVRMIALLILLTTLPACSGDDSGGTSGGSGELQQTRGPCAPFSDGDTTYFCDGTTLPSDLREKIEML